MSQSGFEEAAGRAVRASELIEEIIQLDELLILHKQHHAQPYELQQYLDRRSEFAEELNRLLHPHHLRVVLEG